MRRILPFLLLLSGSAALAQSPGPQVFSFLSADDTDQPYAVYIPPAYAAAPHSGKRFPLVISLHGAWSNHRLNLMRVFGQSNLPNEPDFSATRSWKPLPDVEMFVASPFARGTMGYRGIAEGDVLTVLAEMKRQFPIDEDRIYLTGLSMGGGGAVEIALTHPDVWAAVAPLCPVPPYFGDRGAANALNVPVFFHHGGDDPVVPIEGTRRLAARMRAEGVDVRLKEYPGVRHNVWEPAYADAAIFKWFAQYKRNPFPKRVRYVSDHGGPPSAVYWLAFRAKDGVVDIDAEFIGPNRVSIRGTFSAWRLHPAGHPSYDPAKPLEVTVNGTSHVVEPGAKVEDLPDVQPAFLGDVLERSHVWVYGTRDNPTPAVLARRRAEIVEATTWTGGAGPILYMPRIAADKDVSEIDLNGSNLILFGTAATNSLIERFAAHAPAALKPAALATHGLLFQIPGPSKSQTILVNAGIPFTRGMDQLKTASWSFIPAQQRVLMELQDYIVYEGSLDRSVASGRWPLPRNEKTESVLEMQ